MYEDKEGIWIGASSGLYLLEPGKGITTRYAAGEKKPYSIPYDHIIHFYRDTAGIFWLATKGGGLIRFNPEDGSYRQFTTTEGLSNNTIYAVYEDDYGKLWLPSNYGLMQFDKKSYQVNTYLKGDGIAHEEFNKTSHYCDASGWLYFGGLAGVTIVNSEDFATKDSSSAQLRLIGCRVFEHQKQGDYGKLYNHPFFDDFDVASCKKCYMQYLSSPHTEAVMKWSKPVKMRM